MTAVGPRRRTGRSATQDDPACASPVEADAPGALRAEPDFSGAAHAPRSDDAVA